MDRIFLFSLVLFSALQRACGAVDPAYFSTLESSASKSSSSVISFGYIIQLIFSLGIVFGFIYIAAKYILPRFQSSSKSRIIEVTDKLVLEPQVTSYVIKAGSTSWLIIVSGKTVARIDKLEGDL